MVTGTVTAETDAPKHYKQIKVQLVGRETDDNTRTVHYRSDEHLNCFAILCDKDNAGGSAFPVGIHHFNFSLQLAGQKLPASYEGTVWSNQIYS